MSTAIANRLRGEREGADQRKRRQRIRRAPVGDHLHLGAAELEPPVVRQRLPARVARLLVEHNKLVLDLACLAKEERLTPPDRIGRLARRHPHPVLWLPRSELWSVSHHHNCLPPLCLNTHLEAHTHEERGGVERLLGEGHAQVRAERAHRAH
eukprot:scaffold141165_cov30-Tisochrysis_lutea.AAC.8